VLLRWLAGLFLIAHGVLHMAIWLPSPTENFPFNAHRSPMFGDVRVAATALAVAAGLAFVVSGGGYLMGQDWWPALALGASAASIVLMLLTFTPWWLVALAIDATIAVLAWRASTWSD
jgi:hypothetical protein